MLKIPSIIKRNLIILSRSRLSTLIMILGPIFLILIIGAGLGDTGLRNIQADIYISNQSVFTDNFLVFSYQF